MERSSLRTLLTDYTDSDYNEQVLTRPEECSAYLDRETVTWIHVQGDAEPDAMRALRNVFGLHPPPGNTSDLEYFQAVC